MKQNLQKIFNVVAVVVIFFGAFGIYRVATKPKDTDQQLMERVPKTYGFQFTCKPSSMTLNLRPFYIISEDGPAKGADVVGKSSRKFLLYCSIPKDAKVEPLPATQKAGLKPAIHMYQPGDSVTLEVVDDKVFALIDIPGSIQRFALYPFNSEGVFVIPLQLWKWATSNLFNVTCYEESNTSSGNVEHSCFLH